MAISALRSSQVHADNKTSIRPWIKSKHCLFQLLLKHLLAKSSFWQQRMWLDHHDVPYSSSYRPVGTRSAPGKGTDHLMDLSDQPSDVLPKGALHSAVSVTSRLLAGYFIKCFQQASNYKMQLPLNTLECYMRDDVLLKPQD